MSYSNANAIAAALVEQHGERAAQYVVDRIVAAIRNHDLDTAKC